MQFSTECIYVIYFYIYAVVLLLSIYIVKKCRFWPVRARAHEGTGVCGCLGGLITVTVLCSQRCCCKSWCGACACVCVVCVCTLFWLILLVYLQTAQVSSNAAQVSIVI